MGFEPAPRQTTADFLTALTSPAERIVKPGFEDKTPRTAAEFVAAWKRSPEYAALLRDIKEYEEVYPIGGPSVTEFTVSRWARQAPHQYVYHCYCITLAS
jgi:ATP-binding cassette subfamily G (WHITE) protein 2 (PDR)